MKRIMLSLISMLLFITTSAKIYIPLVKSVPPSSGNGGDVRVGIRTSTYAPLAFYEKDSLFIQYPVSTVSSVIITNDSTETVEFSAKYDVESSCIKIDFSTFVKYQNCYNISVNAFGSWWVGYFDYSDYSLSASSGQLIKDGYYVIADESDKDCNYGIYGVAGNAPSGFNFAVSGLLSGEKEGTGIYGSSNNDFGIRTGGRFAGFFHGDLKTTDAMYASTYNTLADSRLNKNVTFLEPGVLDDLMQMNVMKYGLEQFDAEGGEDSVAVGYFINDSGILEKEHFGLSGQEIKDIYPNLVSESQNGYLSVNYMEMIPLLIQSIQELKRELDSTKDELRVLQTVSNVVKRETGTGAVLCQNTPNPFRETCLIKCKIPQNSSTAILYIHDVNGRQTDAVTITERGDVYIKIEGSLFDVGTYLYSLVVDGLLIDSKRMLHIE